ncbi:MAG TPA: type 2 isopentenyl-diphosphate Delta-isomerase [Verrucomicrobia bacterium]|nr:type 2 isopentenyl-diphosphate Delta-isomerase [Verrucomicrobiota bacterium]
MSNVINERKHDHLRILRHDKDTDRRKYYFDDIRLTHRALPDIDLADVDTRIPFMGKTLSFPLLISCMTGGRGEELLRINRHLAEAAEATGVAMGTGSQRVMLEDATARDSFMLRKQAPTTLLLGNLGAVQLNYGITPAQCNQLVRDTGVDAICLHLNPLQEAVQPEGDTRFRGLTARIRDLVACLEVPVIVKEVGCGIGLEDALTLLDNGVRYLDIAGAGGTSWSRIEHGRDPGGESPGLCFQDWGIPTPDAIYRLAPLRDRLTLIASGGIRTGLDMAKAMILGATLCGIARPFLDPASDSTEAVIAHISRLQREFQTALFLLGIPRATDLIGRHDLILNAVHLPPAGR